ncbi:MAG: AAA family ATPase [Ardenticatenia bacterium]|jgi:lon-related putative ATP-dependent protease|nr:AAA family ATPase [Ardenticatenia bacterium]MBK8542038.1 AAA family ATPase [Ardenticatenia bacterium]
MTVPRPLPPDSGIRRCNPETLGFASTAELEPLVEIIGQPRAVEAVRFGVEIDRRGYHIFAHGPGGSGKSTTLRLFLNQVASLRPAADDLCYIFNFEEPYRPRFLRLPAGRGAELSAELNRVVEELLIALPAAFETDAAANRRQDLIHTFESRSQDLFETVRTTVATDGIGLLQTPEGLTVAPLSVDGPMTREAFAALPEPDRVRLRDALQRAEAVLETATRSQRLLEREAADANATLDRDIAAKEVNHRIAELDDDFAELPDVMTYLSKVRDDILDHLELLRPPNGDGDESEGSSVAGLDSAARARVRRRSDIRLRRWAANVLVDHAGTTGAPVHFERLPTLANLVGRIEYEQRGGSAMTDHTLIKPGALHRANGGYLVLEAEDLLAQPYAWDALKRALRHQEVRIEPPNSDQNPITAISLDPQPMTLGCKVILTGSTSLYFALHQADNDLAELFKVSAEFAASMDRTPESELLLARFVANTCRNENIRHLDAPAVARLIEYSARDADNGARLSNHFLDLTNVMHEADYWAGKSGRATIAAGDVNQALHQRESRSDLSRQRMLEAVDYGLLTCFTEGMAVGQVNGLTVLTRGEFSFGMPSRITAVVGLGTGLVSDIEGEVALSGAFHSKGVRILEGFLRGRYLSGEPFSIAASITFEQSYALVDGDSASTAELAALLSALTEMPLRQDLAVTGALDQMGRVQPIGGINEKVEGFFRVCRQNGLTGTQGVLLPLANVQQLMLSDDVLEAIQARRFYLFPIATVDEAMALLTGHPAGERQADGQYPAGTVNGAVELRLRKLVERRLQLSTSDVLAS